MQKHIKHAWLCGRYVGERRGVIKREKHCELRRKTGTTTEDKKKKLYSLFSILALLSLQRDVPSSSGKAWIYLAFNSKKRHFYGIFCKNSCKITVK